jgi:phage terminase Nu1 subunit (DNA packaging protein)
MATNIHSIGTIARLFNLTERRVQQLAQDGIIPKGKRGEYDLVACVRGYIAYLQQNANGRTSDVAADRNRLVKAQADRAELECRMLLREVIPVLEVEESWARILKSFQSRILSLPMRLVQIAKANADQFAAEAGVRELLQDVLTELSTYDPERGYTSADQESAESRGTSAQAEDKPVGRPVPETQ